MQLYCNHPEHARPFLPCDAEWRPARTEDFAKDPERAIHSLVADAELWTAAAWPEIDGHLLVVDHATQSQFLRLQQRLQAGHRVPDAFACIALEGSGFVGQRGRAWSALRGNLHLTVHRRLSLPVRDLQAGLVALPAVAAAETLDAVVGSSEDIGIKWVNDVFMNERKVGGVLTATHVQGGRIEHVLFGIGLNVARAPDLPALPWVTPATCLAEVDPALGDALPRVLLELLRRVWMGVDDVLAGRAAEWVERYRQRSVVVGRCVRIDPEEASDPYDGMALVSGRVLALTDDLGLVLEGVPDPVRRGRLTLLP